MLLKLVTALLHETTKLYKLGKMQNEGNGYYLITMPTYTQVCKPYKEWKTI